MEAVIVKELKKSYNTFPAIYRISFSIKQGEVFGLLNPNGAGKISVWAYVGLTVTIVFLLGLILLFPFHLENSLLFVASIVISSITFSSLGAFVSVSVKQVFEAQTLANLFRFPMIFLSGVFMPVYNLPSVLKPIAYLMPLTYSIDSIKVSFGYEPQIVHPLLSLIIILCYSIVFLELSVKILKVRMS